LLQMLSKTSVDEVFIHHFEKNVSLWGLRPQNPIEELPLDLAGNFRPSNPLIAYP